MDKPKTLTKKRSKLPLIIAFSVLGVALVGFLLWFFVFRKVEPEIVLTDAEYLSTHSWEKEGAPTVVWTFKTDGTAEITTNRQNYYEATYSLEPNPSAESAQLLKVTTSWLNDLQDTFDFTLNREEDTFVVKNHSTNEESIFIPLGTAEAQAAEDAASQDSASDEPSLNAS